MRTCPERQQPGPAHGRAQLHFCGGWEWTAQLRADRARNRSSAPRIWCEWLSARVESERPLSHRATGPSMGSMRRPARIF